MDSRPPLYKPLVSILAIPIPKTQPLSYEKTFSKIDDVTSVQLKRISESRQEVVVASERAFAEAAIKGVQKYLPELFGLMNACEDMPPDFTRHLHIDWTSALALTAINGRHSSWYWECTNVLYCFGLLHRKHALDALHAITEEQFSSRWTEATKLLSTAAGIFQYIAEHVASRFFVFPKDMPMPEVFPETFTLLSRLSVAEAQELAVKRAVLKENNPQMASQLAMAVAQEYDLCQQMADKIQIPERKDSWLIRPSMRTFLIWKSLIWKAIAYRYMGDHHLAKQEPGVALAYLELAATTIDSVKPDVKAMDVSTDALWDAYERTRSDIKELYAATNKDNDAIYHEIVRREQVQPIQAKMLAKPSTFEAPKATEVTIQTKDSSGTNLCIVQ